MFRRLKYKCQNPWLESHYLKLKRIKQKKNSWFVARMSFLGNRQIRQRVLSNQREDLKCNSQSDSQADNPIIIIIKRISTRNQYAQSNSYSHTLASCILHPASSKKQHKDYGNWIGLSDQTGFGWPHVGNLNTGSTGEAGWVASPENMKIKASLAANRTCHFHCSPGFHFYFINRRANILQISPERHCFNMKAIVQQPASKS